MPFVAAFQIGIFDSQERFGDQTVRVCDRRSASLACEGDDLLALAKTDADGLVQLLVRLVRGVAGPLLPRTYLYVDPTAEAPTRTGVRPATLAHQLEGSNNIAPWADPATTNVIGYRTLKGGTARYLYGSGAGSLGTSGAVWANAAFE